jgi:hypothetical protein
MVTGAGSPTRIEVERRQGAMRIGNVEVRPLGGAAGCLAMIVLSVLASVVLTLALRALG